MGRKSFRVVSYINRCKRVINLRIDGTNKRIPKIIGEWKQK